jgi:hypothetical protein
VVVVGILVLSLALHFGLQVAVSNLNNQKIAARFPFGKGLWSPVYGDTGVAEFTVESVQYPVSGPGHLQDANVYARVCAGKRPVSTSFLDLGFSIRLADGTSIGPDGAIRRPALGVNGSLDARQCTSGFVSFELPNRSAVEGVEFLTPSSGTTTRGFCPLVCASTQIGKLYEWTIR